MSTVFSHTIVATITGSNPAAVAVIRLSGPEAFEIAGAVFSPWPRMVAPRHALIGRFETGESGIALPFVGPHSYTGDDVVELSCHGGRASVRSVLDGCLRAGAKMAEPGEFTLRAFLNGKLDLSEAEAVAELVEAQTERELRLAQTNQSGGLRREVKALYEKILGEIAYVEATVDFSEEIGEFDFDAKVVDYGELEDSLRGLIERGRRAHLGRVGIRVALVGLPNSGKSSLLNTLLGFDRAIVTATPGTTRDTLEETVDWNGLRVVLTDTAGVREAVEMVEAEGVRRSLDAARLADLVFYLFDSAAGWTDQDDALLAQLDRPVVVVGNKADLAAPQRGLPVSALHGTGLDGLLGVLEAEFGIEGAPPVNERQGVCLGLAVHAVGEAREAAALLKPPDLIAVLLRDALMELGSVTGETVSDEMLSQIFSRFCIGK